MGFFKNFSRPEGLVGKLMLNGMNHEPGCFYRWAFSHFEWQEKTVALDIGCGGGMNIKRMLLMSPEGKACGIDISDQAVIKSTMMNRDLIGKRCLIRKGGAESIPFKDGVFDLVTAFETIYFWEDVPAAFKEVRRVLKPGGMLLVACKKTDSDTTWEKPRSGKVVYTPEALAGFFEDAGFSDINVDLSGKCRCCVTARK